MSELAPTSAFAKILAAQNKKKEPLSLEQLIDKVALLDFDLAQKVFPLCTLLSSKEQLAEWKPEEIRVMRANCKDKDLRNRIGVDQLYFVNEEVKIPESFDFFPLYVHTTHRWWPPVGASEERLMCHSIDGHEGLRFEGPYKDTLVKCGHESCPNFPARGTKTADAQCRYSRTAYLVDRNFSNVYFLDVTTWSFKHFLSKLENKTRVGGNLFGDGDLHWFGLTTKEDGNSAGTNSYFSLVNNAGTDTHKLSDAESEVVKQLQLGVAQYHLLQVNERKEQYSEKNVDVSQIPDDTVVDMDEDDSPEHVDM